MILHRRERWIDRSLILKVIHTLVQLQARDGGSKAAFLRRLERIMRDDPLDLGTADADPEVAMRGRAMATGGRWGRLP